MEPSRYAGIAQFGPAYQVMLARDPHAPGSVDCVLVHRMVRLCADTAEWLYTRFTATESRYQVGSRPELERRAGAWGAVDASTDVVYRHGDGRPASTWDLMADPALIEAHGPAPYTSRGQFRRAALSNYPVWESSRYDYSQSRPNDYYRSILDMALKGWPGGLRWLHGEDGARRSK